MSLKNCLNIYSQSLDDDDNDDGTDEWNNDDGEKRKRAQRANIMSPELEVDEAMGEWGDDAEDHEDDVGEEEKAWGHSRKLYQEEWEQ